MNTKSPQHWAIDLTHILNARDGSDRFPVNVQSLAQDYSQQIFPDDPVTLVRGKDLEGFEGGLFKAPIGKEGWGIIYNSAIASSGRINFTVAHEFGHYLLHRHKYPNGIQCKAEDMVKWGSEYGQIEQDANVFAANLLVPRDDFERQILPKSMQGFDQLKVCAERYGVSLAVLTLRYLLFTEKRALFIVSKGGYIQWARSSPKAYKSGAYIKTANVPQKALPLKSLAAQQHLLEDGKGKTEHDAPVWLNEPWSIEETIVSERYGQTYTLLHLDSDPSWWSEDYDKVEDICDRMIHRTPGSSWLD